MSTAYTKNMAVAVDGCNFVMRALSTSTRISSAIVSANTRPVLNSMTKAPVDTVPTAAAKVTSRPANIQPKVLATNWFKVPKGLSA